MGQELCQVQNPPPGLGSDWVIPQDWRRYAPAEHALWDRLFARQTRMLPGRAAPEFMQGLDMLRLSRPGVPDFDELSDRLMRATGWSVVAVPGLVPEAVFFEHLSQRRFVAARFLRRPDQVDYLQEPDVFHDVFGHVPLLAHPVFADYMQAYGEGGLRALRHGAMDLLARLYWYTVEFGLICDSDGLKLYGAGIVSSRAESLFALESRAPHRAAFDLRRVLRTRYRIDDFQQTYFVIESFEDLLNQTLKTDFAPIYRETADLPTLDPAETLPTDKLYSHGDQSHALQTLAQKDRA